MIQLFEARPEASAQNEVVTDADRQIMQLATHRIKCQMTYECVCPQHLGLDRAARENSV
jgi:hypothetical protein